MQFPGHDPGRAGQGAALAPAITGTVVGTDPHLSCQCCLDIDPFQRKAANARFKNNRGRTLADTVNMQFITADIDPFPGRMININGLKARLAGPRILTNKAGPDQQGENSQID